jgi:hypothetical protein
MNCNSKEPNKNITLCHKCCRGKRGHRGHKGDKGDKGDSGTGGGSQSLAYGYAVGTGDITIGADTDVVFSLGASIHPNSGFTSVPSAGGTAFVIKTTGVYEFFFSILGITSLYNGKRPPSIFSLYVNGVSSGASYTYLSVNSDSETICDGHGIISLVAGDSISVHNVSINIDNIFVSVSPYFIRTFTVKQIE